MAIFPQSLGQRRWPGMNSALPKPNSHFHLGPLRKNCPCTFKGRQMCPGDSQGGWAGREDVSSGLTLCLSLGTCLSLQFHTLQTNSFLSPPWVGHLPNWEALVFTPTSLLWALAQHYNPEQSRGRRGPGQLSMAAQKPRWGPFQFDLLRHSRCKMKSERWNLSNFLLLFFLDSY